MCRSCAEGQKRCKGDTSDKRRLRRKASQASSTHKASTINRNPVIIKSLSPHMEKLREEALELKKLLHVAPLADRDEQDKIDSELEIRITALGLGLASEAEKRSGFDRSAFDELYNATSEDLDKATENFMEKDNEAAELEDEHANTENPSEELERQVEQARAALEIAQDEYDKACTIDDKMRKDISDEASLRLAASYREVIGEIREVGGTIELTQDSDKVAYNTLQDTVGKYYPTEWIEASNNAEDNLRILAATEGFRPHYSHDAQHEDLELTEANGATYDYDYSFTAPIPVDQMDDALSKLGERYSVYDAREFLLNEDYCRVLKVPTHELFNPSQHDSDEDGTPKGEGWEYTHYVDYATKKVSNEKTWVKYFDKTLRIVRPEIIIPTNVEAIEDSSIAYHEFAHRTEAVVGNGAIMRQEEAFLRRRTTDAVTGEREDNSFLFPTPPGQDLTTIEIGRRNGFFHHYVGKEYIASHHREVLSVGAESLFGGNNYALMGLDGKTKNDNDHKAFVLGIFATV